MPSEIKTSIVLKKTVDTTSDQIPEGTIFTDYEPSSFHRMIEITWNDTKVAIRDELFENL